MRSRPKITYEQYKEAVRVHRIHTETPYLSDLAREWGIHRGTLISAVNRGIKVYDQRIVDENSAA